MPGERLDAGVGQAGAHARQLPAVDTDRALLEVELESGGFIVDEAEVAEQRGDGPVAPAGCLLGFEHRCFDDHARLAGQRREARQHSTEALRGVAGNQRADGDSAGVAEGIERLGGARIEVDGIEGVVAGLDADPPMHRLDAAQVHGQAVAEGVGGGLDGEGRRGVADRDFPAIDRASSDRQTVRVRRRQVGCDLAASEALQLAADGLEDGLEIRFPGLPSAADRSAARRFREVDRGTVAGREGGCGRWLEEVEAQLPGDVGQRRCAADAGSEVVEPRREGGDAQASRRHCQHAPRDAALRRQTDVESGAPGGVVEAAGEHHRQHVADHRRRDHPGTGQRMAAASRQGCRHHRQIAAADQHRALLEVEVEGAVDRRTEHAEMVHQVGDGSVAVPGGALGKVDRGVDAGQRAAGVVAEQRQQIGDALAVVGEQSGDGDGAGVDHGVVGTVLAVELNDRVESVAARLDPDPCPHRVDAEQLESPAVGERLGERLQGELAGVVADSRHFAVRRAHSDREELRIDLGELGNVGRDLAVAALEGVAVGPFQGFPEDLQMGLCRQMVR